MPWVEAAIFLLLLDESLRERPGRGWVTEKLTINNFDYYFGKATKQISGTSI